MYPYRVLTFRAESGKIGQPWVGNRGECFQADAGAIFRHYPRNFQEHLRQKVGHGGVGGWGGDYERMCIYMAC